MTQVRVTKESLLTFATACFAKAGAEATIAKTMAESLLWGDLLGFRTHGMRRLPYNVKQLQSGAARGEGSVQVLNSRAAVETWDANGLPGLFVAPQAVEKACTMALHAGTGTVVVRRCEHVASLAAYLQIATDRGLLVNLMAATPAQSSVAPAGSSSRVFSPNPYAIGVPTNGAPLLLDMSFSVTAAGKIRQAYDRNELLPWPAIVTKTGEITNNPKAYIEEGGAILPLGGADLGYKGYGLCLQSELWTLGLSGYGRAEAVADGEQNTFFVQVIDPEAFAGKAAFVRVAEDLLTRCLDAQPIDSSQPVRIPGSGALANFQEQTERGVLLDELTWPRLQHCAKKLGVESPAVLGL
ncbi:lactate dehydrogenase [Aliidiomarina iranensis]|uniref:Lactate dehydrogenase n=1 Tax=Aliidiomarina iranensis TaxID=1434071 RepID=A0A432VQJ5_9GAMM|nr:Ldh family oxidoreductase [Aliidiomarina iranensis]RUO18431.1 lactate dehydrogenase [Aliidiomarina iranensis]